MGYRMVVFRIRPDKLWDFHATLREWALTHAPGMQKMLRCMARDWLDHQEYIAEHGEGETRPYAKSDAMSHYDRWNKAEKSSYDNEDIHVQVFTEDAGTYLLRLHATIDPDELIKQLRADTGNKLGYLRRLASQNKTDMTAADIRNKSLSYWMDEQIKAKRYMSIPALEASDAWSMAWSDKDPSENELLAAQIEAERSDRTNPKSATGFELIFLNSICRRKLDESLQDLARLAKQLEGTITEPLVQILTRANHLAAVAGVLAEAMTEKEFTRADQDVLDLQLKRIWAITTSVKALRSEIDSREALQGAEKALTDFAQLESEQLPLHVTEQEAFWDEVRSALTAAELNLPALMETKQS